MSGGETGGDSVFDRKVLLICTEEYDLHLKNYLIGFYQKKEFPALLSVKARIFNTQTAKWPIFYMEFFSELRTSCSTLGKR